MWSVRLSKDVAVVGELSAICTMKTSLRRVIQESLIFGSSVGWSIIAYNTLGCPIIRPTSPFTTNYRSVDVCVPLLCSVHCRRIALIRCPHRSPRLLYGLVYKESQMQRFINIAKTAEAMQSTALTALTVDRWQCSAGQSSNRRLWKLCFLCHAFFY